MAEFAQANASLESATEEAVSKDRAVSAKVNAKGELVELKFPTQKYRQMAPAELAGAIKDVIDRARNQMSAHVAETLGRFAPEGVNMADAMNGRIDPTKMMGKLDLPFPMGTDVPGRSERPEAG
ncbi:YbaB/EbfC family nucleoid-associated protein [Marinactinospora rubrisoli]|uniref:YbaB/EbfC family nucleoid-associated protein n=1 Tax=Marinactinospora rubrisoli TaxID=2715399 RepID=A0ABW2KA26_9ACTN